MWYGQEVSGDYETGGPNSGALTGPPILLTEDLWLMYHSREETDGTQLWDIRKVQLSTDSGGNWSDLHQSYDDTDQWYGADAIDLSAYAGQVVRVRFWFDTVDAGDNQHKGWLVDDVEIGDLPPPIPALGGIGILTLLGFFLLALLRRSGR